MIRASLSPSLYQLVLKRIYSNVNRIYDNCFLFTFFKKKELITNLLIIPTIGQQQQQNRFE